MSKLIQDAWNITTEKLVKFSLEDSFENQISMAFSSDVSINLVRDSFQNIIEGTDIPTIVVLPTTKINGANGAFATKTNTIYLAQEHLESNDSENVSNLLLEELGHYLDWRLNEVDSPGDEGAIFSALVNGETLKGDRLQQLKIEDDTTTVVINEEEVRVELSETEPRTIFYHPTLLGEEIKTLARFANAVYEDDVQVDGWEIITEELTPDSLKGNTYSKALFGLAFFGDASAVVARKQNTLVLSFRGTEFTDLENLIADIAPKGFSLHYSLFKELFEALNSYIQNEPIEKILVTGHSLGGAMVEMFMAENSGQEYSAVSFASPLASEDDEDERILNIGNENDLVYSAINSRDNDGNSTLGINSAIQLTREDNPGSYTHSMDIYEYLTERILNSHYYGQMKRNSFVIIDRTDIDFFIEIFALNNTSLNAFILGEDNFDDTLRGANGNDVLEGLGGNDNLNGNDGNDFLDGGEGRDSLFGNNDRDALRGGGGDDVLSGGSDTDDLDGGIGNDVLNGGNGTDFLVAGENNDFLDGGEGVDIALFSDYIENYDYDVLEDGSINFTHARGTQKDGLDNLENIEYAIFFDRNILLNPDDSQQLSLENVTIPGFGTAPQIIETSPDSVKNGLDSLLLNVGSNLNFLVAGLNGFLTTLTENLVSNFIENEYPLIGSLASSDNLALISELDFVSDIRISIIEKLNEISGDLLAPFRNVINDTLAEPFGLSEDVTNEQTIGFLEELLTRLSTENPNLVTATQQAIAVTFGIPTGDVNIANFLLELDNELTAGLNGILSEPFKPIKEAIYDAVGEDGINLLQDNNGDNEVTIDDIDLTVDNPNDLANAEFNFALSLGSEKTLDTSLATDIGFDGLGLEIEGEAQLGLDFDLNLDFGFNQTDKFYLNSEGEELTATLGATIPDLALEGELGFLQVDITDEESNLGIDFSLDIEEPDENGDRRITSEELNNAIFSTDLDLGADVNLGLVTSFDGDTALPSIETDFNLDWNFENFENNEDNTFLGGNNKPTIAFNNIRLDLGSFFSDFAKPVVETVQTVTQPIRPLVNLINQKIDIGIFDFTVLEIAETLGAIDEEDRKFVESFDQFVNIINSIPTDNDNLKINLGDFNLGNNDPRQEDFDLTQIDLDTIEVNDFVSVEEQVSEGNGAGFVAELNNFPGEGLQFPILTNPKSAIALLFGQDVDLFTYDLPELGLNFNYISPVIPIVGPLGVQFGGEIGAKIDLAFGFDTEGLKQYVEAEDKNPSDIFSGFFVNDFNQAGEDVPEASLILGLDALLGVELGIASAGVGGGIEGVVNFDLNDPNNDGKVRIDEFEELLDNPECIFDISGEIAATVRAYIKLGFFKKRFNLARFVLGEFATDGCDDKENLEQQPILATNINGELTVNVGANAENRINGELNDEDDYIIIEHISGSVGNENILVSGFATTQEVNGIDKIVVRGGKDDDYIELKAGVLSPAELEGNEGDDFVIGGDGDDLIAGNDGFDLLDGGNGRDTLEGGNGDDWLIGGAGADTLRGGAGEDTASYGTSTDFVLVNVDNPAENQGDAAEDTFESIEQFEGSNFNDTLIGNENNDVFSGLDGNDSLQGNTGNDTLDGGEGNDTLNGGEGNDSLVGGAGADVLEGGAGEDSASYIFANEGLKIDLNNSSLNESEAEGDSLNSIEIIEATAYEDTLLGSNLSDTLKGFFGNDLIVGRTGDDYLEGSSGNDTLQGDEGADTLDGGDGLDVVSYERANSSIIVDLVNSQENTDEAASDEYTSIEGVIGTTFDDVLMGNDEDNLLVGLTGSDRLFGRDGNDTLIGSEGADTLDGGDGLDVVSYERANSAIEVDLANPANNTDEATGDEYISIEEVVGTNFDDVLAGDAENNLLVGLAGSDRLLGNEGNDTIDGNLGNDTIDGGEGDDTILYRGNLSQYQIEFLPDSSIQITDSQSDRDDSDVLNNVEFARFADRKINLARNTFEIFNPNSSTQNFVNAILDDNSIEIVENSINFVGGEDQSSFYNGRLDLGIDTGILLTSGSGNPPTENTSSSFAKFQLNNTDEDLQLVADEAFENNRGVKDANTLEFSFTVDNTQVNSISFDVLFGSEEYPEFVDNFVDIAGVFINGQNVALFNNESTQPLSVIRENLDRGNFIDNSENVLPIEYNGVSSVLSIIAPVEQGLNTIKFGIADTGDTNYDSGLFIANLTGRKARIGDDGSGVVVSVPGTNDDDRLVGSENDEFFDGKNGNDFIDAGAGNDVIDGGAGADTLNGGNGQDVIDGGSDSDLIEGGLDADTLSGSAGADIFVGTLVELNNDIIVDFSEEDFIIVKNVSFTEESLIFVGDTATLEIDADLDSTVDASIILESNFNSLNFSVESRFIGGVVDTVISIQKTNEITGTPNNDFIEGDSNNNAIDGLDGDDSLNGNEGSDTLIGGSGDDELKSGAGNDLVEGGNGNDLLKGGDDNDTLLGDNDRDNIFGEGGNDSLVGGNGDDTVFGGLGNDSIFGSPGNDRLSGDEGDDSIDGDEDDDKIFGGNGADILSGGFGNDTIFGQEGDDIISGGDGNDELWGNDGNDTLKGGEGEDRLIGGAGNDVFVLAIGEGIDVIEGFEREIDKIQLPNGLEFSDLNFSSNNILDEDNTTLATINISADNLTESDFI